LSRLQQEEQISQFFFGADVPLGKAQTGGEVAQQQSIRFWTYYGTGNLGTLGLVSSENNIFFDPEPFPFPCGAVATVWTFVLAFCKKGREGMLPWWIKRI